MASFYLLPQASPTMTTGVLAKWQVQEGAVVVPQTIVAQVETDKATMDIEIFEKTTFLKLLGKEGEEIPANFPIAIIGNPGEDLTPLLEEYARLKAAPAQEIAPVQAAPVQATPAQPAPAQAAPVQTAPPVEAGVVKQPEWMGKALDESVMELRGRYLPSRPRLFISPLARAMVTEAGIDPARVKGTGPNGRIVAADVAAFEADKKSTSPARAVDTPVRVTQMRKTIARRLTEVHQQVPVFYLTATFDVARLVFLKEQAAGVGKKISYNDLLLKAVARALKEVPECNAAWNGDAIIRRASVDIGVAVALPEGLITPVVRDADKKGVSELAEEVRALAGRAKEGKLNPEEYTGGSFTVSNLGMFGIEHFTAILNPPEAAILAVGGVNEVPVVEKGMIVPGWRMKVTMTCDHRVIDGALGARFLGVLRTYLENPALLVL
jgi:pyruvate dehydrogenase E2 component (dihydrolipoamide acetyltransferase)